MDRSVCPPKHGTTAFPPRAQQAPSPCNRRRGQIVARRLSRDYMEDAREAFHPEGRTPPPKRGVTLPVATHPTLTASLVKVVAS